MVAEPNIQCSKHKNNENWKNVRKYMFANVKQQYLFQKVDIQTYQRFMLILGGTINIVEGHTA